MRPLKPIAALVLATTTSLATAQALPGEYSVSGKEPGGRSYVGKLTIVQTGPTYRLTYRDTRTQRGMGIQKGNALFAAWGPNSKCTVSALEINADGSMNGPWGDLDQNALGTERLARQSGAPGSIVGTYASTGNAPNGDAYSGVTNIEQRGELFKVTFRGGGEQYDGVAVRFGNTLGVSYGGPQCGVTAYEIKSDGSLAGVVATYGESLKGSEEMRKGW